MTEYTPTTEQMRDIYVLADPAGYKPRKEYEAEFNSWLEQVKADAWDAALDDAYRVASATAACTQSIDAILVSLAPRQENQ